MGGFLRAVSIAPFLLCACRSVPKPACFPARGSEAWVERHLRAGQPSEAGAHVEVHLVADTSSARVASDQQEVIMRVARVEAPSVELARSRVSPSRPASVRLRPGTYAVTLYNITYVTMSQRMIVVGDDSIVVEAKLRRSEYCLDPIVTLQH